MMIHPNDSRALSLSPPTTSREREREYTCSSANTYVYVYLGEGEAVQKKKGVETALLMGEKKRAHARERALSPSPGIEGRETAAE